MGYPVIHTIEETSGARPHELFLVDVEDLRHWADEAAVQERRALRRILEAHMREALLDGVDPAVAMAGIAADLDARDP